MSSTFRYTNSGCVWLLSGALMFFYALLNLLGCQVPGIEELVEFLSGFNDHYIYLAAFFAIFIEGIYLIGNIFPGSTILLVLILGVQAKSDTTFFLMIAVIYIGWVIAGLLNVVLSKAFLYFFPIQTSQINSTTTKKYLTWFPAFMSNHEVSNMIAGSSARAVIINSLKRKFITCLFMMIILYAVKHLVKYDISSVSNDEGFISLMVIAFICFYVGLKNIKKAD